MDKDIAENSLVRILNAIVDSLNSDNFKKLCKETGRCPYHPEMMLKVILYAYMNNVYSCRKIEQLLLRDIHYIWLAGYEQPDFITINRLRNRVKDEINTVFTRLVLIPADRGFVSLEVEYTDGAKIESRANKYTFVRRKTEERNRAKLLNKIRVLLEQVDEAIAQENAVKDTPVEFTPAMLSDTVNELKDALEHAPQTNDREQKKVRRQKKKQIKELQAYRDKLMEYDTQLATLAQRNSYSGTDPDATFIRMKEDAMNNEPGAVFGQMKYNMAYRHFRHVGKDRVAMDFAFFATAFNLKKLCAKLAKAGNGDFAPNNRTAVVVSPTANMISEYDLADGSSGTPVP
ncbi:MAG: transposase [Tannerella sp.]|jgi:transposase|nr:transposase [Tannerella sp.]